MQLTSYIASKIKYPQDRIQKCTFDGNVFELICIEILDKSKSHYLFPNNELRRRDIPLLIVWYYHDEEDERENEYHYAWYQTVVGEMCTLAPDYDDDEYRVDPFSTADPLTEFNEDQGEAFLDGSYWDHHTKFIDVYCRKTYIIRIYRDVFDGKRRRDVVFDFEWYFYIKLEDFDKAWRILDENQRKLIKRVKSENEWLKIYAENRTYYKPRKDQDFRSSPDPATVIVDKLTRKMETFEGDLSLADRYVVDEHVEVDKNLKILYFDIETDDSEGRIEIGKYRILSIAAIDREGNECFKCFKDEKKTIVWFIDLCKNYDIIVGWNSHFFDADYITERAREYKIYWAPNYGAVRLGHVDLMRRVEGTMFKFPEYGLRSVGLDHVSEVLLGKNKVAYEGKIIDLFNKNKKKLEEYNIGDNLLTKEIDEYGSFVDLMISMCAWTGTFPAGVFKKTTAKSGIPVSRLIDSFVIRRAKQENIHYRTSTWDFDDDEKFKGGAVLKPIPGFYRDVYCMDFSSLYPSIIWSWKISPENLVKGKTDERTTKSALGPGIEFYKDRVSIYPLLIEELLAERKVFKNMRDEHPEDSDSYKKYNIEQQMTKELANSMYGQLGQKGNRYYAAEIAGSITAGGRALLFKAKEVAEELGHKVIYGDTDSILITEVRPHNPDDVANIINKIFPDFLKEKFNIDNSIVGMAYEKHFSHYVIVGGKNYTGRIRELDGKPIDKIIYKGIDCIRKQTIAVAKRCQEELIGLLFQYKYGLSFYVAWMGMAKREFYSRLLPIEEITTRLRISKHPSEYDVKNPHVRVAEQMIKEGKEFYIGIQIPYVFTDKKEKVAIHVDDYKGFYDKDYYWNRVYAPLARILEVTFPEYPWKERFLKKPRAKRRKPKKEKTAGFRIKQTVHNQLPL